MVPLVLLLPSLALGEGAARHHRPHHGDGKDTSFDLLILTQHWPFTTCLDWEENRHGACRRIEKPAWTVHGVWPTQFHRIAPGFCNDSWPFDAASVEGIEAEMAAYWPDVEMRDVPDSLWTHEWTKHGTCAVGQVDGISSQQDYFRTGCRLGQESPVTGWLATAGVTPSDTSRYTMKTVWDAVVAGAGTRPHIDCQKIHGQVYIKEVKVCYSKQLERVDCDGIQSSGEGQGGMQGTCLRWPEFLYPASSVPPALAAGPDLQAADRTDLQAAGLTDLQAADPAGLAGLLAGLIAVSIVIGLALAFFFYKRRNRVSGYESL